jgi:hypothetical protein
VGTPPEADGRREPLVYCLTRDHELAAALDERLNGSIVFFYNDAARLHQAIVLRAPHVVVIDTAAIRPEFGDAGLGPVVAFVRERATEARIAVRPGPGADWLVGAEAGVGTVILPGNSAACAEAVAALSS